MGLQIACTSHGPFLGSAVCRYNMTTSSNKKGCNWPSTAAPLILDKGSCMYVVGSDLYWKASRDEGPGVVALQCYIHG